MQAYAKHLVLGVLLAWMFPVCAAQTKPAASQAQDRIAAVEPRDPAAAAKSLFADPLGGIIINRTVTVLGNDFYQYFAQVWREKDSEHKFSVSIYERPTARWGSEVWVQFRQKRVFRIFLSPARQAARKVGEQAAQTTYKNIMDSELQRLLFQSKDLGPEEM